MISGGTNGSAIFCDWITVSEFHRSGGLPILVSGITATFDAFGNCRFERGLSASVAGSYDSAVRVQCDGYRVWLSGNVGRFNRQDNLFNFGWPGTVAACNRILARLGLPALGSSTSSGQQSGLAAGSGDGASASIRGAIVSRLDLTCNYRTGSDAQARAVIRWLSGRSVARMKRGYSGDESVWWSNTRHMLKAYRKGAEMRKHGGDEQAIAWAEENGIVRVEVELKKRALHDLGFSGFESITQESLEAIFADQTEIFRRVDMSDEPDILSAIPARSRAIAAAWMAGVDVRGMLTNGTLYRHAKVLREYGIDILEHRSVERFPVRVRVVDLEPVAVPDWYDLRAA